MGEGLGAGKGLGGWGLWGPFSPFNPGLSSFCNRLVFLAVVSDTAFKRFLRPTAVSASELRLFNDDVNDRVIVAMAVAIVMQWRWRCFFLELTSVQVRILAKNP